MMLIDPAGQPTEKVSKPYCRIFVFGPVAIAPNVASQVIALFGMEASVVILVRPTHFLLFAGGFGMIEMATFGYGS